MRLVNFIFIFLFFNVGLSQTYRFNNYTIENGIPQNFIYSIDQDKNGYLWIGTGEGLSRFDGHQFKTYKKENGLVEDVITCSYEATDGSIWFGHNSGAITQLKNGIFIQYPTHVNNNSVINEITGIGESIYFISQNIGVYSIIKKKIKKIGWFKSDGYYALKCIDEKNIVLGTANGIMHIVLDGLTWKLKKRYYEDETITTIYKSKQPGAYLFASQNGKLRRLRLNEGNLQFSDFEDMDFSSYSFKVIMEDADTNIWLGTYGQGLLKLIVGNSEQDDELIVYNENTGLSSNYVNSVFQDMEGNIWIGTFGAGLSVLVDDFFTFYSHQPDQYGNNVKSIWIDEHNRWFGVENGLIRISAGLKESWSFYNDKNGFVNDHVTALYEIDSVLWIGTRSSGLYKFDLVKDKIIKVDWNFGNLGNAINQITGDKLNLVVATEGGLILYAPSTNTSTLFNTSSGLAHNSIKTVYRASNGKIWMGTQSRLLFALNEEAIEEYEIRSSGELEIVSICEDINHAIWIATSEKGVYKLLNDSLTNYSTQDGLMSNYCYSVHADVNNNIWVGHRGGLSKINEVENKIVAFDHNSGIKDQVNQNAMFLDSRGYLWIGTESGAIKYDPTKDKKNNAPPKVNITKVQIGEKYYNTNDEIRLPYGDYRIQFDYIGISFKNSEQVTYQYSLNGYDERISDVTKETTTTYGRVSDGEYEFTVFACNSDDVCTINPAKIKIIIDAPIWKKWWFYLILTVLLSCIVILVIRVRLQNLRKAKIILEEQLEIKTKEVVDKALRIEEINKDMTDSINYAKRIQTSILPETKILSDALPNSFVFFQPRDIVSGDFYFIEQIDNRLIIACVDCTGHGVPGAFMSMIGSVTLRNLYAMARWGWKSPEKILVELDKEIETILHQKYNAEMTSDEAFMQSRDGMDITLCEVNLTTKEVLISSAMRNSIIIQNKEIKMVPGDKKPIGGGDNRNVPFTLKRYHMEPGDSLFLFSDGFPDQFGGPDGRKLKVSGVNNIIQNIQSLPRNEHKSTVETNFKDWIADWDQIDDVLFIGILF